MKELAQLNRAKVELAKVHNVDEVKSIRDMAEALRAYHQQVGTGLVMQNQCAEIVLWAERRAGEILRETPKQKPGQYQRSHDVTVAPSLADLGIEYMESHRWQRIAAIPEAIFEKQIDEVKTAKKELTTADMLRLAGSEDRAKAAAKRVVHP